MSPSFATPLSLKRLTLTRCGTWSWGLPAQPLPEQESHFRRACGSEMVLNTPTADTAADDRAKVDATKYPLPLHFLSPVTVRLHAVCSLSSVKMLTNPASVVLTLSVSDDDNVVRTSSGVAQLRLADRASNPDRSEVPSESFPGQLTDSSWPSPQPKARGSARFSRPDPDLRSFPADLSARSVYWRERNGRQDIQ